MKTKPDPVAVLLYAFFGIACGLQLYKATKWGHESWPLTEWLINYAGGFVRRGLPGELILWLSKLTGLRATFIVIFLSYSIYGTLIYILSRQTKSVFPTYFLISPVLLGSAAYADFIIRKDCLGILLMIGALMIATKKQRTISNAIILNGTMAVAILSHESFMLFGFPVIVIAYAAHFDSNRFQEKHLLHGISRSLLWLFPTILVFLSTALFHGDSAVAQAINLSWKSLWPLIEPDKCCFADPAAAIDSISWSAEKSFELSARVTTQFSYGIYIPLAWAITILFCGVLLIRAAGTGHFGRSDETQQRERLVRILTFQFALITPLFFIGWDFGRWIFLWTVSSTAVFVQNIDIEIAQLKTFSAQVAKLVLLRKPSRYWILLVFGFPGCCWTVYEFIAASPAGILLKFVIKVLLKS